jgi:hypothetical protein
MGFAAEIVFALRLGLFVFGPKRLRAMLGGLVPTKPTSKTSEAVLPSLQQVYTAVGPRGPTVLYVKS